MIKEYLEEIPQYSLIDQVEREYPDDFQVTGFGGTGPIAEGGED
jgi:hypothetical protein